MERPDLNEARAILRRPNVKAHNCTSLAVRNNVGRRMFFSLVLESARILHPILSGAQLCTALGLGLLMRTDTRRDQEPNAGATLLRPLLVLALSAVFQPA